MKRILILSDPPAKPGYLPRLRYLCEFLARQGYGIRLVTEEYEPLAFAHSYPIDTIRMYSGSKTDWLLKSVWTLISDWHNRAFARRVLKKMESADERYDLVVCSTFNEFPLGAAQRIAKRLSVPLICDIRDLDEQVDDSRYQYHHQSPWLMPFRRIYRAIHIRRRNKVLRAADAVTTVSLWHADFIRRFNAHVHVIYNGYDPAQFYPQDIRTEQFSVCYIGSLFEWQKKGLEEVRSQISEFRGQKSDVRLEVHTPQAEPVSHEELGDVIRRSGIMLVLSSRETHGMLTTKFYEALGCSKPVLCVPSDEGALAELIKYTQAGVATDDPEIIRAFIEQQYKKWQANGFTRQPAVHREEFSRETQCARMEEIIRHLLL